MQVVDAANVLIQDDTRVGTVLLVMAKHGLMEWVPAKQNLRPITLPAGPLLLLCHFIAYWHSADESCRGTLFLVLPEKDTCMSNPDSCRQLGRSDCMLIMSLVAAECHN